MAASSNSPGCGCISAIIGLTTFGVLCFVVMVVWVMVVSRGKTNPPLLIDEPPIVASSPPLPRRPEIPPPATTQTIKSDSDQPKTEPALGKAEPKKGQVTDLQRATTYLKMASNLEANGNKKGAIMFLSMVANGYPETDQAEMALKWIAELGGTLDHSQMPSKAEHTELAPSPGMRARAAAAARLQAIEKMNALAVYEQSYSSHSGQSTSSRGSGSVHVRSYFRKDGTYVRAHTRGSPGR